MRTYGIQTEDIIIICPKKTLVNSEISFTKGAENKRASQDLASGKYCSGVLYGESDDIKFKLMSKSPAKLSAQIKNGALYLK